jgi:stage II sporulation protein R
MGLKPWLFTAASLLWLAGLAPPAEVRPVPPAAAVRLVDPARTPDVLRFRVIANSDTPYDQAVKIAVRNAVLNTLDPLLTRARGTVRAEAIVRHRLAQLRAVVDRVLTRDHVGYGARVVLTRTVFPTKAYGSWLLPAGPYEALLIILGRGQGHNWWCVLYPALCFIDVGMGLSVPANALTETPTWAERRRVVVVWWLPRWLQAWLRRL